MDTLKNILARVSVRDYSDKEISDDEIRAILDAAMSGPTAVNARPWSFIVVKDKDTLAKMADANGKAAQLLKRAPLGILVCGDLDRAFRAAPDYWVIDGSIAAQNMILAANAMGIGSCWLGTWPQEEKMQAQAELFGLPESIVPHSIIAFGYPKAESTKQKLIYEEDRVHFERW
ncbi:MAG: nitroreductase family protein [Anaerofustis stercorihominis]|nr:nitroreductase family protein [Anaerofustis stercorihominis]